MTPAQRREAEKLIGVAARRYTRRVWWADRAELTQEGWVAAMCAARTFDPRVGIPWVGYCWRAVVLAMKRALWDASAPVSSRHDRTNLRGLVRAPVDEEAHVIYTNPERDCAKAELRAKVHRCVSTTLSGYGAQIAWTRLADAVPSVKDAHSAQAVYSDTAAVRTALRMDQELKAAWHEWTPE